MRARTAGYTLIELLIVVALISIVASIAVPKLLASRLSANETKAVAMLKNLVNAQAQFQLMGLVDIDQDGFGEYGWEGEMSGAVALRGSGTHFLNPSVIRFNPGGNVMYTFTLFLPGPNGAPLQSNQGASPGGEDTDLCEVHYLAYAWPTSMGTTGRRVFVVNQDGEILQTDNTGAGQGYSGQVNPPLAIAALAGPDMTADVSRSGVPGPANDGGIWVPTGQ